MATQREIELCQEILGIAIMVNSQGRYHAFVDYAAHVAWFEVRVYDAYTPIEERIAVEGWSGFDSSMVKLSTEHAFGFEDPTEEAIASKVDRLASLKSGLSGFLINEVAQ